MAKISTPRRRKLLQIPILIVEDNADQWLIMRAALAQCFPEVEPVWVNNVAQAITYLKAQATEPAKIPRLVLSDLYLPRREEGLTLLEFVKNHVFYQKPPIIILSSSKDKEDIGMVYSFSSTYIVKPGSYHEWLNCFYTFRRYWWEIVSLPLLPH